MKRTLSILLIVAVFTSMVFAFTGCGVDPDFAAPLPLYGAYKDGENVVGKTVAFTANNDYSYGRVFYTVTADFSCSIEIEVEGDGAENVKEGDSIVVKVNRVEEELAGVIFIGELVD